MPKGYNHLVYEQRCQIYALLKRNISQNQIARDLGVSQSTISRELKRNKGKRKYRYKQAQRKSSYRRLRASIKPYKLTEDRVRLIENWIIGQQWSPEQISGYMKRTMNINISHERIYQHVWRNKHEGGDLYKHLRCSGKKYNKRHNNIAGRGIIPNRISIEQRPEIVDKKARIGDFEIDTIIGSQHRGAIVSLVERKSKLVRLMLIPRATAELTKNAIIKSLKPIKKYVHTLTADNGKEFAQHQKISKSLRAQIYFAHPYHAWERGLNENTNGLVRQYFPKKTDFTILTHKQVQHVEYLLNTRPRKSLEYKTPIEVFLQLTGKMPTYALHT